MFRRVLNLFKSYTEDDRGLIIGVRRIAGYKPLSLELFRLATMHSSRAEILPTGYRQSNERLEYLGDAILGAVVAEYLFKKYPFQEEGFLTEIRSRIVNRESLNLLAKKIALDKIIRYEKKRGAFSHKSIYGDCLEAFVGAVYLDRGYSFCKQFIIKRLLIPHFDLDTVIKNNPNYKSQLIEWAQKNNKVLSFEVEEELNIDGNREFNAKIIIDGLEVSEGKAPNKKKAEQTAAFKASGILAIEQ